LLWLDSHYCGEGGDDDDDKKNKKIKKKKKKKNPTKVNTHWLDDMRF
jgi:hypothetical protein